MENIPGELALSLKPVFFSHDEPYFGTGRIIEPCHEKILYLHICENKGADQLISAFVFT